MAVQARYLFTVGAGLVSALTVVNHAQSSAARAINFAEAVARMAGIFEIVVRHGCSLYVYFFRPDTSALSLAMSSNASARAAATIFAVDPALSEAPLAISLRVDSAPAVSASTLTRC